MEVNLKRPLTLLTDLKLWAVFLLYLIVAGYGIAHHELWGDEVHSWNIAKASGSFSDLIANTRYEGHPPVWYIILWGISKFTYNLVYVQAAQFIIAGSVVFLLLFYSPFSRSTKILIPFGYYFLFEYGMLSRNYAIGILAAFCICYIIQKNFRYKLLLYYTLLFFMTNTHLLAMVLAGCLHFYFLLLNFEQAKRIKNVLLHAALGVIIFLPAMYFIFPPSDSAIHIDEGSKLNIENLRIVSKIPLRAFMPVPAWWENNFWNTQFLLALQVKYSLLRPFTLLLSIGFLGIVWLVLKGNKKALAFFVINLVFTFILAFIFPLVTQRYIGFIFIGFIAAAWLRYYEIPVARKSSFLIDTLLIIQLIAGAFTVAKDIRLPFSNSYHVNELINEAPKNEKIVTDYWCVNTISAFTDKTFYCIGPDKEVNFLLWKEGSNMKAPGIYSNSIKKLFTDRGLKTIYLVSMNSPQIIFQLDPQVKQFQFDLVDKREGAIEKWSNLYLYKISPSNSLNQ